MGPSPHMSDDNMFNLCLSYALRLWAERQFILKAVFAGAVLSAILAMLLPKQYESTTQLMPPQKQGSSGSAMLAGKVGARWRGIGQHRQRRPGPANAERPV